MITGEPLSFFATLGMISLAGIIINKAIVLIDQIDIERQSSELKEAVVLAAQKRVTPILLTSLTTVFGLLPMAITGGALFEPMASLMIGGLSVASILTLFRSKRLLFAIRGLGESFKRRVLILKKDTSNQQFVDNGNPPIVVANLYALNQNNGVRLC